MRTLLLMLSGCCVAPADGLLPAGTWGGDPEPTSLTVNTDGTGSLDLACAGGSTAESMLVVAGGVHATFSFDPDSWGPDDIEEHPPFDVVLDGTVCGRRLTGTITSDDPEQLGDQEISFVLGRGRGLEVPCAQ